MVRTIFTTHRNSFRRHTFVQSSMRNQKEEQAAGEDGRTKTWRKSKFFSTDDDQWQHISRFNFLRSSSENVAQLTYVEVTSMANQSSIEDFQTWCQSSQQTTLLNIDIEYDLFTQSRSMTYLHKVGPWQRIAPPPKEPLNVNKNFLVKCRDGIIFNY